MALETRDSEVDTAPWVDLGMVCVELQDYDAACAYFDKAYQYGKKRAFQGRPKKYLNFYLERKR